MQKKISFLLILFIFLMALSSCKGTEKTLAETAEKTNVPASSTKENIISNQAFTQEEKSEFAWKPDENSVKVSTKEPVGTILMNNDYWQVLISDMVKEAEGDMGGKYFAYVLSCENKSDKKLVFNVNNLAINGYELFLNEATFDGVEPGGRQSLTVWSYYPLFDSALTDFNAFKTIEFDLSVHEGDSEVIIYDKGEEPPEIFGKLEKIVIYPQEDSEKTIDFKNDRTAVPGEVTLIDDKNIKLITTWFGLDTDIYGNGAFKGYTSIIYIENKTDEILDFNFYDVKVDDKSCNDFSSGNVRSMHRLELWKDGYADEKNTIITEANEFNFKVAIKTPYNEARSSAFDNYEEQIFNVKSW